MLNNQFLKTPVIQPVSELGGVCCFTGNGEGVVIYTKQTAPAKISDVNFSNTDNDSGK